MSVEIIKMLNSFESPFKWYVPEIDVSADKFLVTKTEKRDNIDDEGEDSEFNWNGYILDIVLAYQIYKLNKDVRKALTYAECCVKHLEEAVRSHCQEKLFKESQNALLHIALTTKGHLLLADGQEEDIQSIIDRITPMKKMTRGEKAAVYGIKADFFLVLGLDGHREALINAKKAVILRPEQAQWHFLLGKTLGRLRRTEMSKIKDEEITAIETANRLEEKPAYIVHKATLYSAMSAELFFQEDRTNFQQNKQQCRDYANIAIASFKKAVALRPRCTSIMARAAHGLLRIKPMDTVDMQYVKGLLDYVVKMVPNNALYYHDLGYYYDKFENNPEKSIDCWEKAARNGNHKALINLILLKWRIGLKYQILRDLEEGLKQYMHPEKRALLLCHLVVFKLIIDEDWRTVLTYTNESLKLDPSGKYFVEFQSLKGGKVNLIEMMRSKLSNNTPRDVTREYDQFIELSSGVNPSSCRYRDFDSWRSDQMQTRRRMR